MKALLLLFALMPAGLFAQNYTQYFDGADTSVTNSVTYYIDTLDSNNIWQVGPPQKNYFSSAYSFPNVLITDTISPYPPLDTSVVQFKVQFPFGFYGIWAFQWDQKLDFGPGDGGVVEFSVDQGAVWHNPFYSPYVYNFFGYNQANWGYTYDEAFVGQDTNWRNVWVCLDLSWLSQQTDEVWARFTFTSDSTGGVAVPNEGWMIDNIYSEETWIHTLNEVEPEGYMTIFPNPADDRINIVTEKKTEFHIIEDLSLYSINGERVRHFENVPTKFFVDVADLPEGNYRMEVRTNFQQEEFSVVIKH